MTRHRSCNDGRGLGGRHDDGPRQDPRRGLLRGRYDGSAVDGEMLRGDRRSPAGVHGRVMTWGERSRSEDSKAGL